MRLNLGRDILIYGASDFVFKVIAFLLFPVFTHKLSPAAFGIVSLISLTTGLLGLVANCGVGSSVLRFYWDYDSEDKGDLVNLQFTGLSVLVVNSLCAIALVITGAFLFEERLHAGFGIIPSYIVVSSLSILFDQVNLYILELFRIRFKAFQFVLLSGLKNLVGVLASIMLVVGFDLGIQGYLIGILLGSCLGAFISLLAYREILQGQWSFQLSKKLIQYGYPFVFSGLAYWIFGSIDRWMLGVMSSPDSVGIYSIAFKFSTAVAFLATAFGQAWSPYVLRLVAVNLEHPKVIGRIFNLWCFLLASVSVMLVLSASLILRLTTPTAYHKAVISMSLLFVSAAFIATTQITAVGIGLSKKTKYLINVSWATAFVNFVLNYLLIPKYGSDGAAFATLISSAFLTIYYLYLTQKLHPFDLNWKILSLNSSIFFAAIFVGIFRPQFVDYWYVIVGIGVGLVCLGLKTRIVHIQDIHRICRNLRFQR